MGSNSDDSFVADDSGDDEQVAITLRVIFLRLQTASPATLSAHLLLLPECLSNLPFCRALGDEQAESPGRCLQDDFDSDEDDRRPGGGGARAKWVPSGQPRCPFGMGCTRKNPKHFLEEAHPSKHPLAKDDAAGDAGRFVAAVAWVPVGKPKCPYGSDCTRQNPKHFEDESHPASHQKVREYGVSSGGKGGDGRARLVPSGLPACKFGLQCTRKNPAHFSEESHPADHPKLAELNLDAGDSSGAAGTGTGASGGGGLGGGSATDEERKKERAKEREQEWEKAQKLEREKKEKNARLKAEQERLEEERAARDREKAEKEERERKERERGREREREKERKRERDGGGETGGETGGR